MTLVLDHLPAAVAHAEDLAARQAMQEAALLAGIAIDNCGTGIAHAIGHALGSLYHVPHGTAVAVGLDAASGVERAGCSGRLRGRRRRARARRRELPEVLTDLFAATSFERAVRPGPDVAFDARDIAAMMVAPENEPMLRNNCVVPDAAERFELAARDGRPLARLARQRR